MKWKGRAGSISAPLIDIDKAILRGRNQAAIKASGPERFAVIAPRQSMEDTGGAEIISSQAR